MLLVRRVFISVLGVVLYRLLAALPAPFTDPAAALASSRVGGVDVWALFAGGPLTKLSIVAVGVTPYLTASLMFQLLEVSVPKLKELRDSGGAGIRRYQQLVRIVALPIAVAQAVMSALWLQRSAFLDPGPGPVVVFTVVAVGGFAAMLALADVMTRFGAMSGVALLLAASVSAQLALFDELVAAYGARALIVAALMITMVAIAVTASLTTVVLPVVSQRLSPVESTVRSAVEFRLLSGGIAPLVFASSLVGLFATTASAVFGVDAAALRDPTGWLRAVLLAVAAAGLARLYLRSTADPVNVANDLTRSERIVVGFRPGLETAIRVQASVAVAAVGALVVLLPVAFSVPLVAVFGMAAAAPLLGAVLVVFTSVLIEASNGVHAQFQISRYEDAVAPIPFDVVGRAAELRPDLMTVFSPTAPPPSE